MLKAEDIEIAARLGVKARTVAKKRGHYTKRYELSRNVAVRSLKRQRANAHHAGNRDLVKRITAQLENME